MIESFPIGSETQSYSLTTEMSVESSKFLPIRSEHQVVQKPIYSSTTEFQLERRIPEEMSREIESLPQRAEKPIRDLGQMGGSSVGSPKYSKLANTNWQMGSSSGGSPKLSPMSITLLFFYYSFYRI